MEKEDNIGADIHLADNNPNLFKPDSIQGAPIAPPAPLNDATQIHRDDIFKALGM